MSESIIETAQATTKSLSSNTSNFDVELDTPAGDSIAFACYVCAQGGASKISGPMSRKTNSTINYRGHGALTGTFSGAGTQTTEMDPSSGSGKTLVVLGVVFQ